MATTYYYFKGKCKWAMVHKKDEKYDNYKIDVYFDEPSLDLFKECPLTNQIKTDEDGSYVTFRRRDSQLIGTEVVNFGKPEVIDSEKNPVTALVGNGSDVVVKVAAFNTQNGYGHRLEAVMVESLIPYEGDGDGAPAESVKAEGLDDIPDF